MGQNVPQTLTSTLSPTPNWGGGHYTLQTSASSPFGAAPQASVSSLSGTSSPSAFGSSTQKPFATTYQGVKGTLLPDSKDTGGAFGGYSSTFGTNTAAAPASGTRTTGGGFGGLSSRDSLGANTTVGGFGSTVLGSTSAFGTSTTRKPFGSVGGFGSTGATASPRTSNLFQDELALSNRTDTSNDANKGNAK
jgi:hypothetical protein